MADVTVDRIYTDWGQVQDFLSAVLSQTVKRRALAAPPAAPKRAAVPVS